MTNPYSPPGADVRDVVSTPSLAPRPALIWLTQVLAAAIGTSAWWITIVGLVTAPPFAPPGSMFWWRLMALAFFAALASFLTWLFFALWRRQRAAFVGGIVFAVLLLPIVPAMSGLSISGGAPLQALALDAAALS